MAGIGRLVGTVQVEPEFQRKGIATAMWRYAKQQGFNPVHSPNQSPSGKPWAKSVGE
jgi:GNAT superfamily N-acetyltransferase